MTQFLKTLLDTLSEYIRNLSVTDDVGPSERITRYIMSTSQFSVKNSIVKHNAFMPPKNRKQSVYRTSALSEQKIWQIGNDCVAAPQEKNIYARGDLVALYIFKTGLKVVPDKKPHPKHADITGWPEEKHEQLMLAKVLAKKATLQIP